MYLLKESACTKFKMQLVFCRFLLEKDLGIVFQYDILVILKSNYKILSCRYFALFNS